VFDGPPSDETHVRLDLVYDKDQEDNSMDHRLPSRVTPASYANETSTGETVFVYASAGAGRVPIEVWRSDAELDYWTLASDASRAEAQETGYILVARIGYGVAISDSATAEIVVA